MPGPGPHLRGAISISPSVDYMERAYDDAKYGSYSRRPYIDIVIPEPDRSVGRAAGQARDVVLRAVRAVRSRATARGTTQREAFGDTVIDTIAEYAPNLKRPHPASAGPDAARHRARLRIVRGQHLPGRADARTAVLPAAGAGLGRLPHADPAAVHVRIGDASGRRHHGRAGPQRRDARARGSD